MANFIKFNLIVTCVVLVLTGCSGTSGPSTPATESDPSEFTNPISDRNATESADNHVCLLYNLIYIDATDPDSIEYEIVPLRLGSIHLNILKFLEVGPCTNCFKIVGFNFPEPGILDVDIEITHPFSELKVTIFDVRGIMMFDASHIFPASGLTMSDSSIGDGELLNAQGFTRLYNGSTLGMAGDFFSYYEGKFATPTVPDADLNGFIRHITDHPVNIRNALYPADSVTQTYSLALPSGEFVLGYAVDASWDLPDADPVIDPMTDFPITANCIEPWKIEVTEVPIGLGLTDKGGQTKLLIDVYDWQGSTTYTEPVVESSELFDGTKDVVWVDDFDHYSRFEVTVENVKLAQCGLYPCLISIEAIENDPVGKPWLDLTTYYVHKLNIIEDTTVDPVAVAEADPNPQAVHLPVSFSGSDSYDPDGGSIQLYEWDWDNDGTFDETGENMDHTWYSPGTYYIQLRVTDDESQVDTLDEPISLLITSSGNLIWAKRAGGTGSNQGRGITILSDNSTIVTGNFTGTTIFGEGESAETALVSDGFADIFIARYNPDGTIAWAKRAGGTERCAGLGITTLSDNSTIVTGCFEGTATFGKGESAETALVSGGDKDIFIAHYNPDGTIAWAKRAGGIQDDVGYGITALSDNSILVTGSFMGSATFGKGESSETALDSQGQEDIFIVHYTSVGTVAWAKRAGGTNSCVGWGITALSDNSFLVTGYFYGTATFGKGEINETVLVSDGESDIFIARYNPDGTIAWAKRAGGTNYDFGYGITTLSDNSFVVTGVFRGSATFGQGESAETTLVSDGSSDIFVVRFNPDGTVTWGKRAGSSSFDRGYGITSLTDDSTVVTGYFTETATFGEGEINESVLVSDGNDDIFVARYNTDGTIAWAKRAGGTSGDAGWRITTLSDNSTVVFGDLGDTATFGEGEPNETVLVVSDGIFIARYMP